MSDHRFYYQRGELPLLVSMPHSGTWLPSDVADRMTPEAKRLSDTDWHVPRLYAFLDELGVSQLRANYSRYLVDLNRPCDGEALYPGQSETGICPLNTFAMQPIYLPQRQPDDAEIQQRIRDYWQPYHKQLAAELNRIKQRFGYALLWDAHSIKSQVPRFFDGVLPSLNLGTADGRACPVAVSDQLYAIMQGSDFSTAYNGRFKGGYITRRYGSPEGNIYALQMEIVQSTYMREAGDFRFEEAKAQHLRPLLKRLLQHLLHITQVA